MGIKKIHQNVYIGIVCLAISGWIFWLNRNLPFDVSAMPRILSILLACLSVAICLNGVKSSKLGFDAKMDAYLTVEKIKVPIVTWIMIVAYIVLFMLIGYMLSTAVVMIALMLYMKQKKKKVILSITFGYLLFIYLFFVQQLSVPIDKLGLLEKLL